MKIYPVEKIREADNYTIKNEPISSIDLMERASNQLRAWIKDHVKTENHIHIIVGLGNNGGDGLALGRMLHEDGYEVTVIIIRYSENCSNDFNTNYQRLITNKNLKVIEIKTINEIIEFSKDDVIIDAIFGSGLTRPVKGTIADIIRKINDSDAITLSVDIPSGLFADSSSISNNGEIIRADYTLSFQFPKLAFLLPENEIYVGNWQILDIGLSQDFINSEKTNFNYLTHIDVAPTIKGRSIKLPIELSKQRACISKNTHIREPMDMH